MPLPQAGATHYDAELGLPDKGLAIKGLFVCNDWDIEHLDLLTGLTLYRFVPTVPLGPLAGKDY